MLNTLKYNHRKHPKHILKGRLGQDTGRFSKGSPALYLFWSTPFVDFSLWQWANGCSLLISSGDYENKL